jgi:hypothetical protein
MFYNLKIKQPQYQQKKQKTKKWKQIEILAYFNVLQKSPGL